MKDYTSTDPKYTEIIKLHDLLIEANIPHEFENFMNGYQVRLNDDVDAVQHFGSYGEEQNLIEIMGGVTQEEHEHDSVLGYLTADEVFARFKYCYEHNTNTYEVEA